MLINELQPGDILTNKEVCETFKVGNMGGMRRGKATNTLVLVSDHTKSLYHDRWIDGLFHYTGMGKVGDQRLDYIQNKTLFETPQNGVSVHLFEVFSKNEYVYIGKVEKAQAPYEELQIGDDDHQRKVFVFPLKVKGDHQIQVKADSLDELYEKQVKQAEKLSNAKLKALVEGKKKGSPNKRKTSTSSYDRDPVVVAYALRRANGICQLCEKDAPFKRKDGLPYLEVHHIVYLANGGDDTIENVAALCPNCHRKMHTLGIKKDVTQLKKKALIKL